MKAVLFSCAALLALSATPALFAEDHGDGHDMKPYECFSEPMCHGKMLGHFDQKMCMAHHGKSVKDLHDHTCHDLGGHDDPHGDHPGHK